MAPWFVRLVGHTFDLERLAQVFPAGNLAVGCEEGEFRLRYEPFERITDPAAARAEYTRLVGQINALAFIEWGDDYAPVNVGGLGEVVPGGSVRRYGSAQSTTRTGGSATGQVIGADGEIVSPRPSSLTVRVALARADADVADALYFLQRRDPTWGELYKALEIIEADGDGEITARGWASNNERTRFTRSANHQATAGHDARHARLRTEPPPNPLTLAEARLFMRRILQAWLAGRASAPPA
jgi:hypothetical protein